MDEKQQEKAVVGPRTTTDRLVVALMDVGSTSPITLATIQGEPKHHQQQNQHQQHHQDKSESTDNDQCDDDNSNHTNNNNIHPTTTKTSMSKKYKNKKRSRKQQQQQHHDQGGSSGSFQQESIVESSLASSTSTTSLPIMTKKRDHSGNHHPTPVNDKLIRQDTSSSNYNKNDAPPDDEDDHNDNDDGVDSCDSDGGRPSKEAKMNNDHMIVTTTTKKNDTVDQESNSTQNRNQSNTAGGNDSGGSSSNSSNDDDNDDEHEQATELLTKTLVETSRRVAMMEAASTMASYTSSSSSNNSATSTSGTATTTTTTTTTTTLSSSSTTSMPTSSSSSSSMPTTVLGNETNLDYSMQFTKQMERNSKGNNNNSKGNPTTTVTTSTNTTNTASSSSSSSAPLKQPDGWRVKLYRLNVDGSWDDCGTGRIVCLYRSIPMNKSSFASLSNINNNTLLSLTSSSSSSTTTTTSNSTTTTNNSKNTASNINNNNNTTTTTTTNNNNNTINTDQWLYQETGEATLCVHAEVTKQQRQPRVLLRTRILLRDAYQRQGDNIITWCEPFYGMGTNSSSSTSGQQQHQVSQHPQNVSIMAEGTESNITSNHHQDQQQLLSNVSATGGGVDGTNSSSSDIAGGAGPSGVDLALSFQDNEGCLDIWRQITQVQGRAAELIRHGNNNNNNMDQSFRVTSVLSGGINQIGTMMSESLIAAGGGNANNNNNNMSFANDQILQQRLRQQQHSVEDMAAQVAAQHHADLQRQHQQELWSRLAAVGGTTNTNNDQDVMYSGTMVRHLEGILGTASGTMTHQQQQQLLLHQHHQQQQQHHQQQQQLPNPPTLQNLEEIADMIAALQHLQQRDALAMWIAQNDCSYLKDMLALFPEAESNGDYGKLATLAACVKTILLMNDPSIVELIVSAANLFEEVCSCLEYDPDLREKANHRWFLRERAKFRTIVPMEDPDLVDAIHRTFRVNYLRDTLLRPTMDESSLSTLSSLQTFIHTDVIKGVTMSASGKDISLRDSYLVRVIRVLGIELQALAEMEWTELEAAQADVNHVPLIQEAPLSDKSIVMDGNSTKSTTWKQHLAPQDGSAASRRLRRRGCISFLRELFNMVRLSLQPCDKDDFFSVLCTLSVDLNDDKEAPDNTSQTSQMVEVGSVGTERSEPEEDKAEITGTVEKTSNASPVNILSLLSNALADPNVDVSEKGLALEIISVVAMHDPTLIRQHCLEIYRLYKKGDDAGMRRPEPNAKKHVLFIRPHNDLIASLILLLDVETDAGLLLQVSEIMRIVLDTDMMNDHGPLGSGFTDEAEGIMPGVASHPPQQHHDHHSQQTNSTDQKKFLTVFYEHYVEWLAAPFQFKFVRLLRTIPGNVLKNSLESSLWQRITVSFQRGDGHREQILQVVPVCAIRCSFAVELLSFCVRAHLYRMKYFLLKSSLLSHVLRFLLPYPNERFIPGDRCLKLATLRFLRAILSVNDEFYHRYIIQHNLFAPVFESFRSNPVGDNLVSSAIVEMCDYIHSENIKSLLEYIVTKHIMPVNAIAPSLEDVSSPYVTTLTVLRKAYEANLNAAKSMQATESGQMSPGGSRYFPGGSTAGATGSLQAHNPLHPHIIHPGSGGGGSGTHSRQLSGRALQDQRKFQEVDQEESYFDSDDVEEGDTPATLATSSLGAVDVIGHLQQQTESVEGEQQSSSSSMTESSELHRTPRMFSLTQEIATHSNAHSGCEQISNPKDNGT